MTGGWLGSVLNKAKRNTAPAAGLFNFKVAADKCGGKSNYNYRRNTTLMKR